MPLSDAQFRQKLHEESQRWTEENLLSPQQREAILLRYAPPTETPSAESSLAALFIRVVLALAVVLIGLAVFLLISFNWKYMPGSVKLSIVGTVLAAAHGGGFYLRKTGGKYWGDAAFFFAGIMYGVGIWQVGQVFHIPADFPMGMWLWALGVFLMALVLGSTPLHLLSVGLLTVWLIAVASEDPVRSTISIGTSVVPLGFIPFFAWSLPLFAALGIAAGILKQNRVIVPLYSLLLVFWWILQGVACEIDECLTFHIVAAGLICLAVSALLPKGGNKAVLSCTGIVLTFAGLIFPSFLGYWGEVLHRSIWNHSRQYIVYAFVFWTFALPVIDAVMLFALFRWRHSKESLGNLIQHNKVIFVWVTLLFALWVGPLCLSLVITPSEGGARHYYYNYRELFDIPLALGGMFAVNVLIVWLAVGLILDGLNRGRGSWFWNGVALFLFWAMIRYFDLFSDFGGMLGTAAIFMFCGLFMLGVAYVWTTRRHKFRVQEPVTESPQESYHVPVWLAAIRDRIMLLWQPERNILTAAVLVAVLQFGILGTMIANEMRPHLTGTAIRVTTVPVDPRNLFRGDYVILRYEFSNESTILGHGILNNFNSSTNRTVFVTMEQDGEIWKATGVSRTRPKEGVFLRGTLKPYGHEIVYGIESYFVQEGTGKAIENAMRRGSESSVVVELMVAPNGKAAIKTVRVNAPETSVPQS